MTLVMAYCVLLSAALAAVATIGDHLLRSRRMASRGLWLAALTLVIPVTAFVMLVPRSNESAGGVPFEIPLVQMGEVVAGTMSAPSVDWLALADASLTAVWIVSSVLLFAAIALGRWRVAREKRRARRGQVLGHDVLLTDDLGPAVAGVRQPVVFVPGWVVALDHSSQRLLIAHEVEHVRRRDTGLLMAGAALTALLPWNPVAWWLARRLRIAVELDCDARVLETHPDVRRYADLLLVAAGKPKFMSRFLAAHFGEHMSDLERRIDAMTNTNLRRRSLGVATAAAAGLLMLACEAPRPEPLAPGKAVQAAPVKQFSPEGTEYLEFQVEKPVRPIANSPTPKYPEILRQAGVEGEALVSFVVDEAGVADPATFKVIKATHELFATAVRQALPTMRFTAAEVGGRKVKQVVQAPFRFTIAGNKVQSGDVLSSSNVTVITGVDGQKRAIVVRRGSAVTDVATPHVVVLDISGRELASGTGEALLNRINPQSIHSIEVLKGSVCAPKCPQIRIVLARGQTLGPPQLIRPDPEETPAGSWEPKAEPRAENGFNLARFQSEPHTVELLSSSGEVVARYGTRGALKEFNSEDISASESYSGKYCKAGLACPLTRIWLKAGREAKYRKR
jgi:TonB family protein